MGKLSASEPPTAMTPSPSMETTDVAVPDGCWDRPLALRVVKVSLKAHWLLVVVETGEDWMRPMVKLFIVYTMSIIFIAALL